MKWFLVSNISSITNTIKENENRLLLSPLPHILFIKVLMSISTSFNKQGVSGVSTISVGINFRPIVALYMGSQWTTIRWRETESVKNLYWKSFLKHRLFCNQMVWKQNRDLSTSAYLKFWTVCGIRITDVCFIRTLFTNKAVMKCVSLIQKHRKVSI